jgi:hypothetical protein
MPTATIESGGHVDAPMRVESAQPTVDGIDQVGLGRSVLAGQSSARQSSAERATVEVLFSITVETLGSRKAKVREIPPSFVTLLSKP